MRPRRGGAAAAAPILALEEGLDALSVALNVMAILFIFEVDESSFNTFLSRPQRAYLEGVTLTLSPGDHKHLAWLSIGVMLATFFAALAAATPASIAGSSSASTARRASSTVSAIGTTYRGHRRSLGR